METKTRTFYLQTKQINMNRKRTNKQTKLMFRKFFKTATKEMKIII